MKNYKVNKLTDENYDFLVTVLNPEVPLYKIIIDLHLKTEKKVLIDAFAYSKNINSRFRFLEVDLSSSIEDYDYISLNSKLFRYANKIIPKSLKK